MKHYLYLFSLLGFVAWAAICAAQPASASAFLNRGQPVSVLLHPGRAEVLRLDLAGFDGEEIFLDTAAQNVSLHVTSSSGVTLESRRIASFGWAAIPLDLRGRGQVELELGVEDAVEGVAGIRVRAERTSISAGTLPAHIRAAQAFSSAQLLHRSLQAEDVRKAILQFQQAANEWARCGDLYGEALALGGKSESQIELSQYRPAALTLARALSSNTKSVYLRGWLNHLMARVYLDQWEPKPAREFAQETLRLGEDISDPALIALGRTDLAGVAFWNFDTDANQIAAQAHAEAIAAGVPETLALERRWKAWMEENVEHNTRAASMMSEAGAYFRQAGDLRNGLEATVQIAHAIDLDGGLSSALNKFLELEPQTKSAGNLIDYGVLAENIGDVYIRLGKPGFADVYYQLAERAYSAADFQRGLMYIYGSRCGTALSLSKMPAAVAACETSLTIARGTQESVFIGEAEYELGLADRKAGRLKRALRDFSEAAYDSHIRNAQFDESRERIQLGEVLEDAGQTSEALAQFLNAESLALGVPDPSSLLEAQYSLASWYEHDGQFDKANAELKPAIEKLEAARQLVSSGTLQASYFAAERRCYELAIELRMREFERDPAGGGDALALELSERSRARTLLDALDTRTAAAAQERSDTQSIMRSDMAVDRAFNRRLKLLVEGGTKRDLDSSHAELTKALSDLEQAENGVQADASQAAKPVPTMSTAEIERASLSSGTTSFEYALGAKRSYLWVIDGGKRRSYVLPSRTHLEGLVKRWRTFASSRELLQANAKARFQLLSAQLSCALFASAVEPHMKRMVVIPDGSLMTLPFAALPENGCSNVPGKPLVVGHEITLTPSLSIFLSRKLRAEKQQFQGEVAIVADPVFDAADPRAATLKPGGSKRGLHPAAALDTPAPLPRLLNAGYEASAIQEAVRKAAGNDQVLLAQGFDASVETVLSPAMRNYRIWHLATHGVYDETMPEFSGLVFSLVGPDGSPRFGFLKAHDIARLNVPAELVVLSACDSAEGENLSGEGVMGLSYSFLRAGAKQVVSTLWSVDDAKSRELMIAFYKELMLNGGNAAAALRQSQLTVMRQPHSFAPYYWAGFELTSLGQ